MERPKNCDPESWAQWNQWQSETVRILSERLGITPAPELELAPYEIKVVEMPPAIHALTLAVGRAASELEGTSEKGDRIAAQLYEALAMFAKETEL